MKVALIIERADNELGGAERSVFELRGALRGLGVEVDILAAKGPTKDIQTRNIYLLCQDKRGKRTGLSFFEKELKEFLQDKHYDIIHSVLAFDFADIYQPRGGSYPEAIKRNAESYQNKIFKAYKKITSFANFRRTILHRAEKRLCANNNGPVIAALSSYVAEQFRRYYNVDEKRIATIHNGVKIHRTADRDAADKLRSQILSKLRITEADNPVLFLFAANNFRLKGLGVLLEALAILGGGGGDRPGYVIAAGKGKIGKYKHLAKKLGVDSKILFLGPVRHIQNVLSITDVAVLPTFYDPSSRFTLEALAAGKPVITTKFNGASELFENNRHGKIIDEPEDTEELANALLYFTDSKNIETASKAIIDDRLKEKVSINRAAEQMLELYEKILKRKS